MKLNKIRKNGVKRKTKEEEKEKYQTQKKVINK